MPFAQLVLGSPGAGKSTYCNGSINCTFFSRIQRMLTSPPVQQFMSAIGRKCSVVNLDPANDHTTYPCAIDVRDLVKLEEIMEEDQLGPNGGVLYALEELEHNMEWLEQGLSELGEDYVLFDCPGQVELYTHHSSLRNIFFKLQKLGYRVRFHSACMVGFTNFPTAGCSTPLRFVLPHIAISLYLQLDTLSASYATDGPPTPECLDENR